MGNKKGLSDHAKPLIDLGNLIGRSERIRTFDPCLPKAVLYQAELHSEELRKIQDPGGRIQEK